MSTTVTKIHKFEAAGLGKAPFKYVGYSREVYQAIPGDPSCPIQPGGSCDYCGQAIYDQFKVKSADGKVFKVGCDCIAKVGDAGLRKVMDAHKAKLARDKRHAKEAIVLAQLGATMADPAIRAKLASLPHPNPQAWIKEPQNALTWAEWMMRCCGAAGRARFQKALAAMLAE